MLLHFQISHIRLSWILFAFHITGIFILVFIVNAYHFATKKNETKVFHFWKFGPTDSLGTDPLQNTLVVVLLGGEEEGKSPSPSTHPASKEGSPPWRLAAGSRGHWRGCAHLKAIPVMVPWQASKRRCFGSAGNRRNGTWRPSFQWNPGGELKRVWVCGLTCS